MQLEAELTETFMQCREARFRFVFMFKAHHEVIRITHDDHVATTPLATPPLDPKIQNVMKVHIGK